MHAFCVLLSLVSLLSGSSLVSAVPVKDPGDVHLALPVDYKTEQGEIHPLANNNHAPVAERHPVILSGPPVEHQGEQLFPAIPLTSSFQGHPPGVSNVRPLAEDFNQNGRKKFKEGSRVALGEGVHVNGNKLSNTFPKWSLYPADTERLLQADHNANPSVSPSRGRQTTRTPPPANRNRSPSPARGGPSRGRGNSPSGSRGGGQRDNRLSRNRTPSRDPGGNRGGPSRDRNRSPSPRRGGQRDNRPSRNRTPSPPRGGQRDNRPSRNRSPSPGRGPSRGGPSRGRQASRTPPPSSSRNRAPSRDRGSRAGPSNRNRDRSASPPRRGSQPSRSNRDRNRSASPPRRGAQRSNNRPAPQRQRTPPSRNNRSPTPPRGGGRQSTGRGGRK